MAQNNPQDTWTSRAMAFVTRSHRHLWGKNNEDPLAFLFKRGLKNDFSKKLLLGWNKFGQNRPAKNWGLDNYPANEGKLFLPGGMVIPYIKEKKLVSVFVHPFTEQHPKTIMIPGSLAPTLILGDPTAPKTILAHDVFDGLFVFQETNKKACLIIHPDETHFPHPKTTSLISTNPDGLLLAKTQTKAQVLTSLFSIKPPVKKYESTQALIDFIQE